MQTSVVQLKGLWAGKIRCIFLAAAEQIEGGNL